jgi:hypothetical protein
LLFVTVKIITQQQGFESKLSQDLYQGTEENLKEDSLFSSQDLNGFSSQIRRLIANLLGRMLKYFISFLM